MAMRAVGIICVVALAIFAQLPVPYALELQAAGKYNAIVSAEHILSMADSMISMAEKTEPGPLAHWKLGLMSMNALADLMNNAFTHGTDGSWEINKGAFYETNIKGKKVVHEVYAAAAKAQTAVVTLLTVQESLKRRPGHPPALKELQIVIHSGSLAMPQSIETHLDDAISAYTRLIKQCQTHATASETESKDIFGKMCNAGAIGLLSGAAAGLSYALSGQVYTIGFGAAIMKTAKSFVDVLKLKTNLTIIQDRIKYLRECEHDAERLCSSLSANIQSLFLTLQSNLKNVTDATASDLRMQDGMQRFLSPDMSNDLHMYNHELLELQDACSHFSDTIDKALIKDKAFKGKTKR